jgi:prevent-host-death family protein
MFRETFHMIVTSIKEARGNLSALLQKVEHGEEVIVTRHGKHIARIIAPHGRQTSLPGLSEFRAHLAVKGKPLSRTVIDERAVGKY